jgi:hypothetical protein
VCGECGGEVDQPVEGRTKEFCSNKCRQKAYRRRQAATAVEQLAPADVETVTKLVDDDEEWLAEWRREAGLPD